MAKQGTLRALIASLACIGGALALTPAASADSISYIGSDGNVWLASPDGSVTQQVTDDGTADDAYRSPSQQDDGTVVAIRKIDSYAFAVFLNRETGEQTDSWLLPSSGDGLDFAPYTGGQISPGGGLYAYDYFHADGPFNNYYYDLRVGFASGPGQTSPCTLNCESGMTRPRWIPGTPYAGMIDDALQGIWIQSETGPVGWFGYVGSNMTGFDVAGGKVVSTVKPEDAPSDSPLTLVVENFTGTPPAATPTYVCEKSNFPGRPRLSQDGSMIAWGGAEGVYVSPTPTDAACTLDPTLVGPGGEEPGWGPVSLVAPDTTAPEAKILRVRVNDADRKAKVKFTGSDNVTPAAQLKFTCKMDSKPAKPCSSPKVYKRLETGAHKVKVRARDATGNVGAFATHRFKVKPD